MAAVVLGAVLVAPAAVASADSFTPVRLDITIAAVAHRGTALPIKVTVSADPGVLDGSAGAMRIGVRLAAECGGNFQTTVGDTLLDQQLNPQPATGKAYVATATGSGDPTAEGEQTVCAYLQDSDVGRVYANDESRTVDVQAPSVGSGSSTPGGSPGRSGGSGGGRSGGRIPAACTTADHRYRAAARSLAAAQRRLRHTRPTAARRRLNRTLARDRRTVNADRRRARAACGSAVRV